MSQPHNILYIWGDRLRLTWDITNKCNLRCKHCAAIDLLEDNKSEYKNYKKLLDYVSDFVDAVNLIGGEPLIHEDIVDIISYLNSKDMKVLIITNGQVDKSLLDNIMCCDIESLFISIEGLKDTHDLIRGEGTWERAISSLKYLDNLNKNRNKKNKVKLGINFVANKLNKNDIYSFIELTKDLDIIYQVTKLTLAGNAYINKDLLEMKTSETLDFFEDLLRYGIKNPDVKLSILNEFPIINEYFNKKTGSNLSTDSFGCTALSSEIYADPYGNISPCQTYTNFNINVENGDNWNNDFGESMKPFLESLHKNNINKVCNECKYQDVCIPCPFSTSKTMPSLCQEALKRLRSFDLPYEVSFELCKPYAIIESEIFYPNLGITTEYTNEGIKILRAIEKRSTLKDICDKVPLKPEDIYEFLLQEKADSKVIEIRDNNAC